MKVAILAISVISIIAMMNSASATTGSPNVFEILSYGGDITFVGGGSTEKMLVISPPSFSWDSSQSALVSPHLFSFGGDSQGTAHAPVDVPDGATIVSYQCLVNDSDDKGSIECLLSERNFSSDPADLLGNIFTTGAFDGGETTLTSAVLNHPVDRDSFSYAVTFRTNSCDDGCLFYAAKITYTVPSGMIVGGSFYPVDNVSLMLAFTIVNSYWMAPLAIGIAAGVYLTKSKLKKI